MLITNEIKDLIAEISQNSADQDKNICSLVQALDLECKNPENQKRYQKYSRSLSYLQPYPLDADGYAAAFDPVEQEEEFYNAWTKYGFVVGKSIADPTLCAKTVERVKTIYSDLTDGKGDILNPATLDETMPVDANNTPLLSRGFFEIYHDDSLAQLRQNVRSYVHHVVIWGQADLWTTFDRYGVKPPHHAEAKGLPLHVDQNPLVHPNFKTLQGVLALTDCPTERGTFKVVPGSKNFFNSYGAMAKNRGEYVELDETGYIGKQFLEHAQAIPLRAGDMVSWDSRTTHANTENISDDTRIVAYISAGPAKEDNTEAVQARVEALQSGFGSNVREALMHASKKPRYTDAATIQKTRMPENLTLLGKLLYGTESYGQITAPHLA